METKTREIYIFGQGSNCMVTSNQIDRVLEASSAGAEGVYMDSGIVQVIVANNRMQDLDGHPVTGNAANHDTNIAGNTFINPTVQTLDGAIRPTANDCIFSNHIFMFC